MADADEMSRCKDCGLPTTRCRIVDGQEEPQPPWEWYMVADKVWAQAHDHDPDQDPSGFLCIECLEVRLGRKLGPEDFPAFGINVHAGLNNLSSDRLRSRLLGS